MSNEREVLLKVMLDADEAHSPEGSMWPELADAILAAGYRKPRTVTTPEEANELPDRAAILTPGGIIFRKWADYYSDGEDAWERELGQTVPAELLDEDSHFPATVLHEGDSK